MASTDISTSSSHLSSAASDEAAKRSVDESFLNKMKRLVERLRLENATLKKSLDVERSGVRALKAQHEGTLRQLKTESKKREEALDKQLRSLPKPEKQTEPPPPSVGVKRLCAEIQSLKAANRSLQEKLKVAAAAAEGERAAAAERRAQEAARAVSDALLQKDARAQVHKLLEEIKSKDRAIAQLKRAAPAQRPQDTQQVRRENTHLSPEVQRMESGASELRKLRLDQGKKKSDREDLKTDIRHRTETFYREATSDADVDSAVSSAPTSLSPQPLVDMWACGQCRAAGERAESSVRECARLTDALRDARDQLELLEFRLLELEDAVPDKGGRENLTDSDSGCVSPGSRLKDSASPELRRADSGYKSPHGSSPASARRARSSPLHEDTRLLADILDRSVYSDSSDSLKSNPVKEHLERMMLSAESAEDRGCLERVLLLLYNLQTLSSSVSDDDTYQIKPKRLCDIKTLSKLDAVMSPKAAKVIATVSPYSQSHRAFTSESLENLSDEPKKISALQESGIFDDVETENKTTQTEVYESLECGDLNTEIQRLNSIREKLEKRGVARHRPLSRVQSEEGLECRCVKLGKRHKQYYERRLKFLEGKISIYEAAQDVKKAKLAQRLQNEFILENRIQDLESQLFTLQEKYDQLEEDCCELEEIENDTRFHCQQLETDYELATAQLRDMSEQRECSRAQAERLARELRTRDAALGSRAGELTRRLDLLERAVPALIAWNVVRALGSKVGCSEQKALTSRVGPPGEHRAVVAEIRQQQSARKTECGAVVAWKRIQNAGCNAAELDKRLAVLTEEKAKIEAHAAKQKLALEKQIKDLRQHMHEEAARMERQRDAVEVKIQTLEHQLSQKEEPTGGSAAEGSMGTRLHALLKSERELSTRVRELERRETAYLEMLSQADDMWAEMEGGYKQRISEADNKMSQLEGERDKWRSSSGPLKQQVRELEQSESALRVSLEKAERDREREGERCCALDSKVSGLQAELSASHAAFHQLSNKFKKEMDGFRQKTAKMAHQLRSEKDSTRATEAKLEGETERARRELARTCKNVLDLEVTNSELREEVESLESQLALMQKTIAQCKRKCEEKIKVISHELSIKTEELEELRSEIMRKSLRPSVQEELRAEKTEYVDEGGYTVCTALPQKLYGYSRMHHSLNYIASEARCSCPSMRSQLVGNLIEDLFERMHNATDEDLSNLCAEMAPRGSITDDTRAKITNYLLMAISKELVRSIGDADATTDTEEWQRAVSAMTYSLSPHEANSNAGVLSGASRLASVSCACAAARLCAAAPHLAETVKNCQEEVLEHSDVKIMEEQLANAIENIVNCPSCALGTNAIVWSTDV